MKSSHEPLADQTVRMRRRPNSENEKAHRAEKLKQCFHSVHVLGQLLFDRQAILAAWTLFGPANKHSKCDNALDPCLRICPTISAAQPASI
jgi:hypothetical protein